MKTVKAQNWSRPTSTSLILGLIGLATLCAPFSARAASEKTEACESAVRVRANLNALEETLESDTVSTKAKWCSWYSQREESYLYKTSESMDKLSKAHQPVGGQPRGDEMDYEQTQFLLRRIFTLGIYGFQSESSKLIERDAYDVSLDTYLLAAQLEELCKDHAPYDDFYNVETPKAIRGYLTKARSAAGKVVEDFKCRSPLASELSASVNEEEQKIDFALAQSENGPAAHPAAQSTGLGQTLAH